MSKDDRRTKETNWRGRSLANYKSMHSEAGGEALAKATTLTQARKIVFGVKPGQLRLKK